MDNVCEVFDIIHVLDDNPLTKLCYKLMQQNTPEFLNNGTLLDMKDTAVEKILSLDDINIPSEKDLLQPMLSWAKVKCTDEELPLNSVNLRSMLNDRLHLVRFESMNYELFGKCLLLVGDGFFSDKELIDLMKTIFFDTASKVKRLPRIFSGRSDLKQLSCGSYTSCCWSYSNEVIRAINKDVNVFVFGFEVASGNTISEITDVLDSTLKHHFIKIGSRVIFHQPLQFENGKCSFKVQFPDSYRINTHSSVQDSFISVDIHSCMSAVLYYI